MSDPETIDWSLFGRTRAQLGGSFLKIVGYFQEDGLKSIAKIEEAMRRQDIAAVILPAHTLKSEARQFGAVALGDLSEKIEHVARRSMEMHLFPDELIPTVARLRPSYEATMQALQREINPLVQRRPTFGRAVHNQDFGQI